MIPQEGNQALYAFSLPASDVLRVAGVSRVSRDDAGQLIGYQRREVRQHVKDIVEYLDGDSVLFPNPIIMALSSRVSFRYRRGPRPDPLDPVAGVVSIPLSEGDELPVAWIVDGQQRAIALRETRRADFLVPITGFITDSLELQRDQFIRVNNTKPLPRSLVTELLPEIDIPLSPRLAMSKGPSAICDQLNKTPGSPFFGLIRRPSDPGGAKAVVVDTSVVTMIRESMKSSGGCLFPHRDVVSGDVDYVAIWQILDVYWSAVAETFPDAWGRPSEESRLTGGVGIRAMGRLMDHVMASIDVTRPDARDRVVSELRHIVPVCRWTEGTWEMLRLPWNELQNTPKHIVALSSLLIRTYVRARRAA